LNRAWIETNLITPFSEDIVSDTHRTFIDGLSYDDATRTLSYESDDHKIICGKVVHRGWWLFEYDELSVNNIACRFATRIEERPVDYGYEIDNKSFVIVTLEIR
jgi:hypothetical protein